MKKQLNTALLFARQELYDQYKGSILGIFWVMIQPMVYILIFTVVFSKLMGARLANFDQPYAYSLYLVSGILIWNATSSTITRLSGIYQAKAPLIKKVPISLSLMPLYIPLTEAVIYSLGMALFALILCLFINYPFTWHWLWIPPLLILSLSFAYTLGLITALLSPFLPDIRTGIPVIIQLLFWMTPIVYVIDILPSSIQWIALYNPFSWITQSLQAIVLKHQSPQVLHLLGLLLLTLFFGLLSRWLQLRLQKDIRDLI